MFVITLQNVHIPRATAKMSENYIVSARKYRPQTFDTVVGQGHITTTLKNAIKNQHLAHAYLFCGPRGVGKTTCARILAKTINCEHPTEDMEACGVCDPCMGFKNNNSFNVFELDAASNNSVDDIRELTNQVRFAPQQGKYKVYIIDEVHMLSAQAFNAFLKTLEEPPPYAIFILATTEKHKILPTILSRCQIFDFKRITTHDIVEHLQSIAGKESIIAEEAALHIIAQKSEGCMRDALSMLDRIASFTNGRMTYSNTMEHLNLLDADFYFRVTDSLLSQDVAGTLLLLDTALEKGFEGDVIISGLAEHFRNLLLCKDIRMAKLLDVPNDHKPIFFEKANQIPPSFIISSLSVINDSELDYKNATNKRLHVEMCLIRLCYVLQATKSGNLLATDDVKKNSNNVASIQTSTVQNPAIGANKIINTPQINNSTIQDIAANNDTLGTDMPIKAAAPLTPAPSSRRLSLNMLTNLDTIVNQTNTIKVAEKKEFTPEIGIEIFEKYKQKLHNEGKTMLYSQFCQMRIEVLPPDEVRLITTNELTETYAKDQRSSLIDFYNDETQMQVRITTIIIEDKNELETKVTVLSKTEIFAEMIKKNPQILRLKDTLNLQIEY